MLIKHISLIVVLALLVACEHEDIKTYLDENFETPKIALSGGIELSISENEIVEVYGYDLCAVTLDNDCIMLTGNENVNVYFRSGDSHVKEQWKVIVVDDSKYSLKRPNGWLVSQPSTLLKLEQVKLFIEEHKHGLTDRALSDLKEYQKTLETLEAPEN